MSTYHFYTQKKLILLLILSILFLFYSSFVLSNENKENVIPEGCYTLSDCQDEVSDPWEGFNRKMFAFNDLFDTYLLKPVAQAYSFVMPTLLQRGVGNFYKNLKEPVTSLNALLQGKANVSGISMTRFLINSTIGLGGFLDVAGEFNLERFNENFNQTLAVWGVESGNYIVLPFLGPSTVRGGFSLLGDYTVEPLTHYSRGDDGIADPYTAYTNKEGEYYTAIEVMKYVNLRASFLEQEKNLLATSSDKYSLFRRIYFQNLKFQIYDGEVPEVKDEENKDLEDDLDNLLE